ncbi:MAG: hypothetical protein OEM52_14260, partial [bacterium]|nr:hypothetical protein [bacterium]
ESAASDSLSREQSKLANDSKALEEQVAQTADDVAKNPQLGEQDAQEFREATNPEQAASQPLRQSANSMQQKQPSNGKQQAKKGAQRAEQLAQKIADMNKKLRENSKKDLANKMMRRVGELLELSKQQQAISDKLAVLDARTAQARTMAEQQEALRRGLAQTIDSIGALGRETFFLPRGLTAELKSAETGMVQATQAITERMGGAQQGQQSARTAMTSGAAKLMAAMGDMQKSSSSTGYEEMMQALAEMARKQAEINDKTGEMAGEQGSPMPMPGGSEPDPSMPGGQTPGGQAGLSQLAAEQGALSKMMQQLEQQGQRMKELTGRLDGIGDQMSEAEKELRDRTVTERTQRLQQNILTRLLDAQRSLQRQDYSQKRESKSGSDLGGRVVTTFDPNSVENQLRQRLFELSRMGVDPVWQKRIREYWQTMTVVVDSTR